MKAIFKGYEGEVVNIGSEKLFYTLDPAAKERFWVNTYPISIEEVPEKAYCWWLCHEEEGEVTYGNGRRRMI